MDEITRSYLADLASLRFLPRPLRWAFGPFHALITAGFLPEQFRDELGLSWNSRQQRLFHLTTALMTKTNAILPKPIREFPWNLALWDTRRRIRNAKPIV